MQERHFLSITCFLVLLIGGPAVYSVAKEPVANRSVPENKMNGGEEKLAADKRSPASRAAGAKAAADFQRTRRNAIKAKSVVIDTNCKSKSQSLEVDGTLLRLRGESCFGDNWKEITVKNNSNGFTAAVIFLKNRKFTTDFIDLQEGQNQISIQAKDSNGNIQDQSITVNRRSPASAISVDE